MLWIPALQGAAMLIRSLGMKSRNRFSLDAVYTFIKHAGLVHDVIDIDCWAQNGSTRVHVLATLKCRVFCRQNEKPWERLLCLLLLFWHSISIDNDTVWMNEWMNENLYTAHKKLPHKNLAPDTHVSSCKLKTTKGHSYQYRTIMIVTNGERNGIRRTYLSQLVM